MIFRITHPDAARNAAAHYVLPQLGQGFSL
jgi:hypothetical protein